MRNGMWWVVVVGCVAGGCAGPVVLSDAPGVEATTRAAATAPAATQASRPKPKSDSPVPRERLPDFYADDEPFNEVLGRMELFNFRLNDKALAAAGVKTDTPVWVLVEKATPRKAVVALLKNLSDRTPGRPRLGYQVHGRFAVFITTQDDLYANHVYSRQFDVTDLFIEDFSRDTEEARATRRERGEAIVGLVCETVDPESWTAGGSRCKASMGADGVLTVTQTQVNITEIEELFVQLRETRFPPIDTPINGYGNFVRPPKAKATTRPSAVPQTGK
ncbi:MAG: hypothetical protein ACAI43_23590 [Phycisphaerae bacterium]|nr:hypothetical protein [Tepidisphaeraceae bacterium]